MSVTLTGTGGLFTRLGVIFAGIRDCNRFSGLTDLSAGGIRALGVRANNIEAQFQSNQQYVVDALYANRDTARTAQGANKTYLQQLASTTLIEQVHADANLVSKDNETALKELIRQMIGGGTIYAADNDVDASTVSATVATVTGITNTGNGALIASVVRPDGRNNEHVLAEVLELRVSSGVAEGATARSETADLKGENPVTDQLQFDWPAGSGASLSITAIDATLNASGNLLYNSSFNTFTTTNQPDYWGSPLVGVYGTDIFEEATTVYRAGTKCLRFTGTGGAPLSSIAQSFAQTTVAVGTSGTTSTLKPNQVYGVNVFMRKSAGLAAGAIQLRMLDSAGSTVINDDAGTANTITVTAGTLTTSFAAYNGFFRTPKTVTPTTAHKMNVRVSTALTSGEHVYIADLAVCEAQLVYTGGPFVAWFAGSTNFIKGDALNVTVANDAAGDFQQYFQAAFDMRSLGLQLPSDAGGTETIVDTLIT